MNINSNDLAGIVGMVVVMAVPIVAILTKHQRQMALIIHGNQQNQQSAQNNEALAAEVRDLKQIVYQQSIAIDAISTKLDKVASADVQVRLTGTQN